MSMPLNPDLEDLLPFYASNRLSGADKARVEAALKQDAELSRRLALVEEERAVAVDINQSLGAPSPRALEALMAKIEAEPKTLTQQSAALKRGLMERFGLMLAALSPRTLAYATAAAVAVIALQGATLSGLVPGTGPAYETASAPLTRGTFVLVSFAPEASTVQLAKALAEADATIVDGPRASGLYRLRLSDKALAKPDLDKRLATLRAARGVITTADPEH